MERDHSGIGAGIHAGPDKCLGIAIKDAVADVDVPRFGPKLEPASDGGAVLEKEDVVEGDIGIGGQDVKPPSDSRIAVLKGHPLEEDSGQVVGASGLQIHHLLQTAAVQDGRPGAPTNQSKGKIFRGDLCEGGAGGVVVPRGDIYHRIVPVTLRGRQGRLQGHVRGNIDCHDGSPEAGEEKKGNGQKDCTESFHTDLSLKFE